jgi:hypothetical protein
MTSLSEYPITAEDQVTIPQPPGQHVACVHADPWWKGVSGLDPEHPITDWQYAAQAVSIALAARYLILDARGNPLFHGRGRVYDIPAEWRAWLSEASSDADYHLRKTALWRVCEHQEGDPGDILPAARDLHAAVAGPSRGRRW